MMPSEPVPTRLGPSPARVPWIDVAKGIGILLVFYGHFVERFIGSAAPAADEQMRWIYAFHMPLFFYLSGLVYKDRGLSFDAFLKRQIRTRLVPAWIFNILGALIALVIMAAAKAGVPEAGWPTALQTVTWQTGRELLLGMPEWNILMWFLITLFMVELFQYGLRRVTRSTTGLVVSILAFAALTYGINEYSSFITELIGPKLEWWHFNSAVSAMVFYQIGILCRQRNVLPDRLGAAPAALVAAAGLAVTVLGFDWNQTLGHYNVVFVARAQYGAVWLYFVNAIAGIAFVVCLSRLVANSPPLRYVGGVTLSLMCLDGILHEFVNEPVAEAILQGTGSLAVWAVTGICLIGTLISVVLCLPIGTTLERRLPVIFGRGVAKPRAPRVDRGQPRPEGAGDNSVPGAGSPPPDRENRPD